MAYTAANITSCNSPAVGADKTTYAAIFDTQAAAVDNHDHTSGKGLQVPTGGIAANAVTSAKIAAQAVTGDKLAANTADTTTIELNGTTLRIKSGGVASAQLAAAVAAALVPPGAILPFAGVTAPTGYLLCDGSDVLIATYPALAAALLKTGTTYNYGSSDAGVSHFYLPDLRGRFLRGWDHGAANDPDAGARTAAATNAPTGDNVGTLQTYKTKMPVAPFVAGNDTPDHTHTSPSNNAGGNSQAAPAGTGAPTVSITSSGASVQHTHAITGGDSETRPPNINCNYIIKT